MKTRVLLLLSLLPALLSGQNLRSRIAGYGTTTLPNAAPFNSMSNIRVEFRIAGFSSGRVVNIGSLFINISANNKISATSFFDTGETAVITLPSGWPNDVLVRIQRDTVAKRIITEAWRADGSEYVAGQGYSIGTLPANASGELALAHNGGGAAVLAGSLAWIRVYNTSVAADSAPPSNQNPGGALLAYEFENNGLDSGSANLPLTMAGSPAYAATALIPQVGEPRTVRAGKSFTVNCGNTGAVSYKWQQIDGPLTLTFSNHNAASTEVSGADVFGQYTLQCTATNAEGTTASTQLAVGAVPTNDAGVVIPPSGEIAFLLAPILRSETSPWPFYDKNRRRIALEIGPTVVATTRSYIDTPLPGTVSIANGSTTVTGVGTSFSTQYAAGSQIVLYYVQAGGQIGRAIRSVVSVQSNTSLTLGAAFDRPSQSGIQHQRWGTGDGGDANLAFVDSLNYYDNVLALYVSYYKTGLASIGANADELAKLWWLYLDRGANIGMAPRLISLEGVMLAAERGVLDKTAVYGAAQLFSFDLSNDAPGYRNFIYNRNTSTGYQNFYYGARESGYAWRFGMALGRLHPNQTTRSAWLPRLQANVQNHYRDYQCKASNPANAGRCKTPEGAFRWQDDFRGGSFIGKYAEEPWHTGIAMQGLIRYHRWTGNSAASSVITDWVSNLMTNTQPGGPGTQKLYLDDVASSFAGVNCRKHYYTSEGGTEAVLESGLHQGAGCTGGADSVYGGRDSNNEIVSSYGYAYRLTGDASIKTRGDNIFGATWGADDGYHGQWIWRQATNRYKTHGQGLCCNDSYLVDRLTAAEASTTPDYTPVTVSYELTSVPGATSVRVTVLRPDTNTATTTCSSSPCVVNLDRVQGQHRVRLEYLSNTAAVLATSDWMPMEVR